LTHTWRIPHSSPLLASRDAGDLGELRRRFGKLGPVPDGASANENGVPRKIFSLPPGAFTQNSKQTHKKYKQKAAALDYPLARFL
jgi:hypothetical protein